MANKSSRWRRSHSLGQAGGTGSHPPLVSVHAVLRAQRVALLPQRLVRRRQPEVRLAEHLHQLVRLLEAAGLLRHGLLGVGELGRQQLDPVPRLLRIARPEPSELSSLHNRLCANIFCASGYLRRLRAAD